MSDGWIGVDLDGTLAEYDGWRGIAHIGRPIIPMVLRVRRWLAEGRDVRIFTARVDGGEVALAMGNPDGEQVRDTNAVRAHIKTWCVEHIGAALPITNVKDYGMDELWDDRAVRVQTNCGEPCCTRLDVLRSPEHLREVAERIAQSMTDSMRHSFRIVTGRELSKSVADQFRRDEIPDVLAILTEAFGEKEEG